MIKLIYISVILAIILPSCGEDTPPPKPVKNEITVYYQHVAGLTPGNPVEFRDIDVGSVKKVEFVGDNSDSIAVLLKFDDPSFKVHCSSQFLLASDGLLGGMKIDITPPLDSSVCFLKKGAQVSGSDQADFIEEILTNLSLNQNGELGEKMRTLFKDSTKKHLFKGLKTFFGDLNPNSFPIQQNISDIKTGIKELKLEMDTLQTFFKKSAASPIIIELKKQYKTKSHRLDSLKAQLKHLELNAVELKKSSKKLKTDFNRSVHEYHELIKQAKAIFEKDSTGG